MKVEVMFKTPDAVDYAIEEIVEDHGGTIGDAVKESLSKWIRYGEVITIEFDTKAGTAIVKET